jgi:hypothetical protein
VDVGSEIPRRSLRFTVCAACQMLGEEIDRILDDD